MNWDKVLTTKCYTPPIRPNIKSIGDTRNFDAKILKEEILDTEDPPSIQKSLKRSMTLNMWNKMHLTDFTYAVRNADEGLVQIGFARRVGAHIVVPL